MYHVSETGVIVVTLTSLLPRENGHGAGMAVRPGVSCTASSSPEAVARAGKAVPSRFTGGLPQPHAGAF
jgi:hypothetical protein